MAKFVVKKRVDLGFLGDDWKECYLEFNTPSYGEVKEFIPLANEKDQTRAVQAGLELLQKLYLGGKGFDGSAVVDVKKEELEELPVEVLTKSFQVIVGTPPPNL